MCMYDVGRDGWEDKGGRGSEDGDRSAEDLWVDDGLEGRDRFTVDDLSRFSLVFAYNTHTHSSRDARGRAGRGESGT